MDDRLLASMSNDELIGHLEVVEASDSLIARLCETFKKRNAEADEHIEGLELEIIALREEIDDLEDDIKRLKGND